VVDRRVFGPIEAGTDFGGATYRAMTLQCPACNTVLGAQLERMFDDAGMQRRGMAESAGETSH
jgi:hypothetical protein